MWKARNDQTVEACVAIDTLNIMYFHLHNQVFHKSNVSKDTTVVVFLSGTYSYTVQTYT